LASAVRIHPPDIAVRGASRAIGAGYRSGSIDKSAEIDDIGQSHMTVAIDLGNVPGNSQGFTGEVERLQRGDIITGHLSVVVDAVTGQRKPAPNLKGADPLVIASKKIA